MSSNLRIANPEILVIDIFHPRDGGFVHEIPPSGVPVIDSYLNVHLLVGIERKWWEGHKLASRFSPGNISLQLNSSSLNRKTLSNIKIFQPSTIWCDRYCSFSLNKHGLRHDAGIWWYRLLKTVYTPKSIKNPKSKKYIHFNPVSAEAITL